MAISDKSYNILLKTDLDFYPFNFGYNWWYSVLRMRKSIPFRYFCLNSEAYFLMKSVSVSIVTTKHCSQIKSFPDPGVLAPHTSRTHSHEYIINYKSDTSSTSYNSRLDCPLTPFKFTPFSIPTPQPFNPSRTINSLIH